MGRHIDHEPLMEEDDFANTNKNSSQLSFPQHTICNNEIEDGSNNENSNNGGVILFSDGKEKDNNETSVTYIQYKNTNTTTQLEGEKYTKINLKTNNNTNINTNVESEEEETQKEIKVPANTGVLPWLSLLILVLCPLGGYVAYDVPGALNMSFSMFIYIILYKKNL